MSPYVNRKYQANTFFAHTATGLRKYTQTPATTLWSSESIDLEPTSVMQAARAIKSFTIQIKVMDELTGDAARGVMLRLSATTLTAVIINHLYYTMAPDPGGGVTVLTDELGTVTIIERTEALAATRFSAMVLEATGERSSEPVKISPMNKAMARNSKVRGMIDNQTPQPSLLLPPQP